MKKRILSILTVLCWLATFLPITARAADAWDGTTVDTSWYTDADTGATEFTIDSAAGLAGLAKLVNEGTETFKDKTITLGDDIDLDNQEWTPIGKSGANFQGTFDGQNHTVSNLTVTKTEAYAGLFGLMSAPGAIEKVTVHNAKVAAQESAGVLAGSAFKGTVENCKATGLITVTGYYKLGGLIGEGYANLTDCSVDADEGSAVTATYLEKNLEGDNVGGLIGFKGEGSNKIKKCSVSGLAVTGTRKVAGLVGSAFDNNVITDCTVSGVAVASNATPEYIAANPGTIAIGGLVGLYTANGENNGSLTDCTAEDVSLSSENPGVRMDYLTGGARGSDSVLPAPTGGSWSEDTVTSENNVTGENTGDNTETGCAKIGEQVYDSLAAAIAEVNADNSSETITIMITESGDYAPFTITRANVTVEAADDVEATITVSSTVNNQFNASNITLKNLNFISKNGATIISFGECDNLTLENCIFTGDGTGTALFTHQPNITIRDCVFKDFAYAYDTCGDNHAAGKITITGNTFDNIRVPINGYWGKPATDTTKITITGNTFNNGNWDASYIQLWDYAQYAKWANLNGMDGQPLNPNGKSAIVAEISGNTYVGKTVIYATHFDWFSKSNLTLDEASQALLQYRVLVELENAQSATVRNADGSEITAFNESTQSSERGGKQVIYSICEGDYIFNIKPTASEDSTTEAVLSQVVKVQQPESVDPTGNNTNKVTVSNDAVYVAKVGEKKYTTLAEAIEAAKTGENKTVDLLSNISIDTWNQVWNVEGMTIKGNKHTITIGAVKSGVNGNYLFYGAEDLNVSDLTINFTTNGSGFSMVSGKLENVKMYGGHNSNYAVFVGTSDANNAKVEISNCLFNGFKGAAVYSQPAGAGKSTSDITVNGTTISGCGMAMCSYAQNTVFTNNTVIGGSEVSFAGAAEDADRDNTHTITGNIFQDAGKIWFYDADLADVTFTKNQVLGNTTVSTDQAKDDTKLNVSENYWGGNAPSGSQLSGTNVTGSDVYYVRPTMKDEDLNTYVPPVIDGGGSSVSGDYLITVDRTTGGKVTVNPGRADKGDTVTITVKPNDGYVLDELTVTAKDGGSVKLTWKDDSKYTFTMPGSQVTVEATFVKDGGQTTNDLPFTDVTTSDWYYDAVEYVYENDLMNGTSANTFSPFVTTSRAMMLTILARYDGVDTSTGSTWYEAGAVWAIAEGVSDGTNLEANLTREQLVTMLWRYAGSPVVEGDLADYPDSASVSNWAVNAMIWAVENGVITGTGTGALNPQGTATRAEVATILMRFIKN